MSSLPIMDCLLYIYHNVLRVLYLTMQIMHIILKLVNSTECGTTITCRAVNRLCNNQLINWLLLIIGLCMQQPIIQLDHKTT